ncbi:hypothetical protein M8R20_16260 [Pseudomonas sp. R2.Fl]|nr:hypothetical protein [Pseudomonas sp. R2.Fl]
MTIPPNSIEGRDIGYQMRLNVDLLKYEKSGGLVIQMAPTPIPKIHFTSSAA